MGGTRLAATAINADCGKVESQHQAEFSGMECKKREEVWKDGCRRLPDETEQNEITWKRCLFATASDIMVSPIHLQNCFY